MKRQVMVRVIVRVRTGRPRWAQVRVRVSVML